MKNQTDSFLFLQNVIPNNNLVLYDIYTHNLLNFTSFYCFYFSISDFPTVYQRYVPKSQV
jgi:hypothetical protein